MTYATSCNISNVKVEEDVHVKEEGFIDISEEVDLGIKQGEIPKDTASPAMKSKSVEVSYVCVCACARSCMRVCVCVCCVTHRSGEVLD